MPRRTGFAIAYLALVFFGSSAAITGSSEWKDHLHLLYRFEGYHKSQYFGDGVYLPGDLNLDGYGDMLVGASSEEIGGMISAGKGYVYSGFDGALLYTYEGEQEHSWFGKALCGISDTDGDGYPNEWNEGKSHDDSTSVPKLILDEFPEDGSEWKDTDSDGIGDNSDAFPMDIAASIDTDGDGYPDEWNPGKTIVDSTTNLRLDAYPNDPKRWDTDETTSDDDDSPAYGTSIFAVAFIVAATIIRRRKCF